MDRGEAGNERDPKVVLQTANRIRSILMEPDEQFVKKMTKDLSPEDLAVFIKEFPEYKQYFI